MRRARESGALSVGSRCAGHLTFRCCCRALEALWLSGWTAPAGANRFPHGESDRSQQNLRVRPTNESRIMMNEAPPPAVIALFPVAFLGMWLGVGALLSELSGWSRLARTFPGGARPSGPRISGQVVGMGPVSENGVTSLIPAAEGLYLYSNPFFRFRRPPILVPWAEIHESGERGMLWWRSISLELGQITTLRVRPKAIPALAPYLSRQIGRPAA